MPKRAQNVPCLLQRRADATIAVYVSMCSVRIARQSGYRINVHVISATLSFTNHQCERLVTGFEARRGVPVCVASDAMDSSNRLVRLNIGGVKYMTTLFTLASRGMNGVCCWLSSQSWRGIQERTSLLPCLR